MSRLSVRLLVLLVALVGLAALALQHGRVARVATDQVLATAVAGYLELVVPGADGPGDGYAPDRLLSTVSRLHGAAFWHAGLQVRVGGVVLGEEALPAGSPLAAPLRGPAGRDTVGTVLVWGTAPPAGVPAATWLVGAALALVALLAATRRASLLWPALGFLLVAVMVQLHLRAVRGNAEQAALHVLEHAGPMVALILLDARVEVENLARLGPPLEVRTLEADSVPAAPGVREGAGGREAVVQLARRGGGLVEVVLPVPGARSWSLDLGLAGGALMAWLATWPPLVPRRRTRLPAPDDPATIPG